MDSQILSLVAFQDEVYLVGISSQDFRPMYHQRLVDVRNAHSICVVGDTVLIVSTGTDEVVAYQCRNQRFTFQGTVWSPSRSKSDIHHINSIAQINDEDVWVTAFGPRRGELWETASNGYICDLKSGARVKSGINQPHSLRCMGENVYYCESALQRIIAFDRGMLVQADGYSRGLCFVDQNTAIFGTSVGRRFSKSTGVIRNPADPGEPFGRCQITRMDLKTGCTVATDMSMYGQEIYDIHVVG
jgi:hypothetical protein